MFSKYYCQCTYFLHFVLLTHSHFVYRACCRWAELRTNMHNINEKVKAMLEGQDVKYRHHIGGAVYVSVTTGYRCIDFRKFFVPDGKTEPKPTRRGCASPAWVVANAAAHSQDQRQKPRAGNGVSVLRPRQPQQPDRGHGMSRMSSVWPLHSVGSTAWTSFMDIDIWCRTIFWVLRRKIVRLCEDCILASKRTLVLFSMTIYMLIVNDATFMLYSNLYST